jgi:hypothetical protein
MIATSSNWNYVIVGYAVTAATFIVYTVWLKRRARRLRRSLSDDTGD